MVIVTEARAISSFSLLVTIIIGFFRLFPPPKPIKTGGTPFFFDKRVGKRVGTFE